MIEELDEAYEPYKYTFPLATLYAEYLKEKDAMVNKEQKCDKCGRLTPDIVYSLEPFGVFCRKCMEETK